MKFNFRKNKSVLAGNFDTAILNTEFLKKMAKKKNQDAFLKTEEFEEFVSFLKTKNLKKQDVAATSGVASATMSNWLKKKEIPRAARDNFLRKLENVELKKKLEKIKGEVN